MPINGKVRILVVVVLTILVLFGFLVCRAPQPVDPEVPVSLDLEKVSELRNLGLAYLENEQLPESEKYFTELRDLIPDEVLPVRNLAVTHTLAVTKVAHNDAVGRETARTALENSLLKLKEIDSSAVPYLLGALAAMHQEQATEAVVQLAEAARVDPRDPSARYLLFTSTQYAQDPVLVQQGQASLRQAYELQPENLSILLDWLLVQLQQQDPTIVETLKAAQPLLEQLARGLEKRGAGVNILEFAKQASEAAEQGNWPVVSRNIRPLVNVVRADDAAKSDRERVGRHPLDFVMVNFSPQLAGEIRELGQAQAATSTVKFRHHALTSDRFPVTGAYYDAASIDFDLDGTLDLGLLSDRKLSVLTTADVRATGEPSSVFQYEVLTEFTVPAGHQRFVAGDLENDGDERKIPEDRTTELCHTADWEVITYGVGGIALFRSLLNEIGGNLSFEEVSLGDELKGLTAVREVELSDINNDGDLDLIVIAEAGLSLWSNRGDLTFSRMDVPELPAPPVGFVAVDADEDVDMDLVLLLSSGEVGILENLRHSTFRWLSWQLEEPVQDPADILLADFNNDGAWEVLLLGRTPLVITFPAAGMAPLPWPGIELEAASDNSQLETAAFDQQPLLWDFDNDGDTDLAMVASESLRISRWSADHAMFEEQLAFAGAVGQATRRLISSDFDTDGDDDLLWVRDNELLLMLNDGGNQHAWIDVELLAAQVTRDGTATSGRVNHYGWGSLLEVRAGTSYQRKLVTQPRTRFGLGTATQADAIRVLWTNGIPENVLEPQARQLVCERQSLKGSCPYLYAWNGERFEFVTDLLWASPIGLLDAQHQLVPAREWEYLKIPGRSLAAVDGEYRLQVTEELWEVAYFDQVELLAVDHPANIDIYSNEKVGPAALAEFKIHTVKDRRDILRAQDKTGRDLTAEIATADDRYAKPFQKKWRQGYTEESWLDLDLGLKAPPERLVLYLRGWIYPTDTSINVALHENPSLPGPVPPSLSVPNEAGEFVEVVPFFGFPGGKTKTIAVELGNPFLTDDYRLRLRTTMEFYWDEIFFTVDEQPSPDAIQITPLKLLRADLHERGVSRRLPHPAYGPELYDYLSVDPEPAWPPILGQFTRFGECRELINDADDRLVIMGAGDELSLTFAVPDQSLPDGWQRDFILHNIGWDKDADLHTVYGKSVEPLPYRGMSIYPDWSDPTPQQQADLQNWHTREMDQRRFWRKLRDIAVPMY